MTHSLVHVEQVMGTAVSFDIREPDVAHAGLSEAVAFLHHIDETFSTHKENSPISRLGRGEISLQTAGDEVRSVLLLCEEIRAATAGVFDVFEVPAPNGTRFDPSGLVKGWSIERVAEILTEHGCRNFCVNAGGDIAVRGFSEADTPWRIGIRHPDQPDALALVVNAHGHLGIATSATYERGAHIYDPRTGQATTELASATVIGPDLTYADAYATSVFVMGADSGLEWIAGQAGYDAYVITHDEDTRWSTGFAQYRVT